MQKAFPSRAAGHGPSAAICSLCLKRIQIRARARGWGGHAGGGRGTKGSATSGNAGFVWGQPGKAAQRTAVGFPSLGTSLTVLCLPCLCLMPAQTPA